MSSKKFFSVTVLLLFSTVAWSAEPVLLLKCPAVPDSYSKMLTDLSALKTAIKKDASCEPVHVEVQSLEGLIGSRRKNVTDLIKKSQTEPLQEWELQEIRNYVEDITKKVFATADLLDRNNYCFASDKKQFGLSDLASLTLDATALAQSLAGPWSAPISFGSLALVGVMQGLDRVFKNRKGFDFKKIEQRQSYVKSLCTFYNFRHDIQSTIFPKRRKAQLLNYKQLVQSSLQGMLANCEGCKRIAELVPEKSAPDINQLKVIREVMAATDKIYFSPLGTHTFQAIAAIKWVNMELGRINQEVSDSENVGRDFVSEIKAEMEQFLFEKEAPRYISFQTSKAQDLFNEFSAYVRNEGQPILTAAWSHLDGKYDFSDWLYLPEAERIRRIVMIEPDLRAKGQMGLVYRIENFQRKSTELLDRVFLARDVQLSYCRFFQQASLYNGSIQESCEGYSATTLNGILKPLESFSSLNLFPDKSPGVVTADWTDGMIRQFSERNKDPYLYKKR